MEIHLNPEQKTARDAPLKPLLIVAGAGTGKTRVLTSRIARLIEHGARPSEICAITFTNKAAKEMAERVFGSKISKGVREKPFIGTFHALGARILRAHAPFFKRNANFIIFDDSDSFALLKKIVKAHRGAQKLGPAFFRNAISKIKDGSPIEKASLEGELILAVYEDYESALRKNNAFDFDDLIAGPVTMFRKSPLILSSYTNRFRHILVDEYQDVSVRQYEFIKLLGEKAESVSVVGDSDQTIYSWRGSNINIFLGFERDWPEAQVVFLEENYRSSGNIIDAASYLISHNTERPRITKEKVLRTANPKGSPVTIFEAALPETEAEWIASRLETLPLSKESVAVLYRTNAQSRALEQALLEREIPYLIFGGLKFYERREIKDILAGLRYALNPEDSVSTDRLQKAFGKRRFFELQPLHAVAQTLPPIETLLRFLKLTDYFSYVERALTNPGERRENIAELIRFTGEFETLPELLEQIALLQSTDSTAEQSTAAHLMTIHLAKGLEFDHVFVAGVSEGILPHARSLTDPSSLEEERRLLYVAMTRARASLALSFYDLPSRFLSELPGDATFFQSETSNSDRYEDTDNRYITLD